MKNNSCENFQDIIQNSFDNQKKMSFQLSEHLKRCKSCKVFYNYLFKLQKKLKLNYQENDKFIFKNLDILSSARQKKIRKKHFYVTIAAIVIVFFGFVFCTLAINVDTTKTRFIEEDTKRYVQRLISKPVLYNSKQEAFKSVLGSLIAKYKKK